MPIVLPVYRSKGVPAVVDRGGTSPDASGLPIAQGLQSVSKVLSAIQIDTERQVGEAARLAEFVDRKGQFSDRIGQLQEALAQDSDHRTYFDRAKKGIVEAATEILSGINDPALKNYLAEHVADARDRHLLDARHHSLKLKIDYSRGVTENEIDRQEKLFDTATDSRDLMAAEGAIDAAIAGSVQGGLYTAQQGEMMRRESVERRYTALAEKLADQDPERFLSNYQEGLYKDVNPLRLEGIRRYAEKRNQGAEAYAGASEVWETLGPPAWGKVQSSVTPVEPGNIDLDSRPVVKNKDGSVSTVRSMSVNIAGKEVLIPTVSEDGKVLSAQGAVEQYKKTGKHLGVFGSPAAATRYAKDLHRQQSQLYTGHPDEAPINEDLMVRAIETMFAGDPEKVRLATASLREKVQAHDKGRTERRAAKLSAVYKAALAGMGTASIAASPEYSSLDGGTQMRVKEHLEDRSWTMSRRAKELSESPERKAEQHRKYWGYLGRLPGMSENEITALYPELGIDLTDDLMKEKRELANPGKLPEPTIDTDVIKHWAREYGINPENSKSKATLGEIAYRVKQEIDEEQAARKRPLTRAEKDQIVKRGLVEVDVKRPRGFLWDAVETKRVFDVESAGRVVVPDDYRGVIDNEFKSRGIERSDEGVVGSYIRLKEWVEEEIDRKEKTLGRKLYSVEKEEIKKQVFMEAEKSRKLRSSGGNK